MNGRINVVDGLVVVGQIEAVLTATQANMKVRRHSMDGGHTVPNGVPGSDYLKITAINGDVLTLTSNVGADVFYEYAWNVYITKANAALCTGAYAWSTGTKCFIFGHAGDSTTTVK